MATLPKFLRAISPLLWLSLAAVESSANGIVRYDQPTMGTVGTVAVVTEDSSATALAATQALAEFSRIDSLMSNWKSTSEVSRLNRDAYPGPVRVDPELFEVLSLADRISGQSHGAFDITVEPLVRLWGFLGASPRLPDPRRITATLTLTGAGHLHLDSDAHTIRFDLDGVRVDLGGIAKGYAADRAASSLRRAGVEDALVNLSGNMVPLGHPPGRTSWKVGLRDPDSEFDYFATLLLDRECVATSGNYEQFLARDGRIYGHILDPRTGWPAQGLDAVTVLAPTAVEADAWATALMVLGLDEARNLSASREDLATVLVQSASDGRRVVWAERELQSRLHPTGSLGQRFEIRWFGADSVGKR